MSQLARICIVTGEFGGPDYNGGIGSANRGLALALREAGHDVDVLYTHVTEGSPFCFRGQFQDQVAVYQELGIRLRCIRNQEAWDDWKARSRQAMEYLVANEYELAFFDDTHGNGYFPLLARHTGNSALARTAMCVVAHGASQWVLDLNGYSPRSVAQVQQIEMERRSLELADMVIAPSSYIVDKYRTYGWKLADRVEVRPNILASIEAPSGVTRHVQPDELVFFGRLETRKGLWTFCRALDRLQGELRSRQVTFLGKSVFEHDEMTALRLARMCARWPFEVRIITSFDSDQAQTYLLSGNKVAIMPSPEDNSPSVIAECLAAGVPFLASNRGGGRELIDPSSHKDCLVEPTVPALIDAIRRVLAEGLPTAKPMRDKKAIRAAYLQLVDELVTRKPVVAAQPARTSLPRQELVLIVPSNIETARAAAEIDECRKAVADHATVLALAEQPKLINEQLGALGLADAAVPIDTLAEFVQRSKAGILHFARLGVRPPAEWFERAARALHGKSTLAALTGIAAVSRARQDRSHADYVTVPETYLEPVRDVGGALPGMFSLSVDSNGGLIAVQRKALAGIPMESLLDRVHGQVVGVENWIHRTAVVLHDSGHRFDLVPDLGANPVDLGGSAPLVFDLGQFARARNRRLGQPAGTQSDLAMRLGFESFGEAARFNLGDRIVRRAAGTLQVERWDPAMPRMVQLEQMMRLAHSVGKVDLAVELATELIERENPVLTEKRRRGGTIGGLLKGLVTAVDLYGEAAGNRCLKINLEQEWSYRLDEGTTTIYMHANSSQEGRATLIFPSVDLTAVEQFVAAVELPDPDVRPVRVRVEIVALDGTGRSGSEAVLRKGEKVDLRHPVALGVRAPSRIELSVEMASLQDPSSNAYVHWIRPMMLGDGEQA